MTEYFETSFGDKIALNPAAEKTLYPLSTNETYVRNSIEFGYGGPRFHQKKIVNKVGITKIGSDLNSYTLLIDFLEELRLLSRTYATAVDIAGAEGVHASLLRGNYAEHVEVADIADGSDPDLTKKLKRALWKYRFYKIQDRLTGRSRRVKDRKHVNLPSFRNYYNFRFKRTPKVDAFIVGDWRQTLTKRYDFIMNFMSFWMWDHKTAIPKIASALNPGGVFATLAPYCWCGRQLGDGGGIIGGQFPFFEQRLTVADQTRYYEQFKPGLANIVEESSRFFDPHRPTLNQYIQCALESGLAVRGTKRVFNSDPNLALTYREFSGDKIVYNPGNKAGAIVADAGEILKNIGRFRSDITYEDLITRGVILVFEKPL